MKRPLGVLLIGCFYIFGAIILLISAAFYNADANSIGISERFGMPNAPEQLLRVIVAIFTLVMAYGYMRMKKWGFWTMITYSVAFGSISSLLITDQKPQPYVGNLLLSIAVIVYTIYVKNTFFKTGVQ